MELNLDETQNPGTVRRRALFYFKEYCDYTGIHGFRYIAEERTLHERVWWITALILSLLLCGLMIYDIILKYLGCPVVVTYCMIQSHINQVPFPAVTICPIPKLYHNYFNITGAYNKELNNEINSGETHRHVSVTADICDYNHEQPKVNSSGTNEFYNSLRMNQTDMFLYCLYKGSKIDCSDNFKPILTKEGVCYVFNILDKTDIFRSNVYSYLDYHRIGRTTEWNIEDGYTNVEKTDYPLRVFRPGARNGLKILLRTKLTDTEFDCPIQERGFWVTLHLPSNVPNIEEAYFTVPLNQKVTAQIIGHLTKTSEDVRRYNPIHRNCYYQSEKQLKFFKIYSQDNCLVECKAEFMLQSCGCVRFYMPRYNDTPVCSSEFEDCAERAEENFVRLGISALESYEMNIRSVGHCDCLPNCKDLTYDWELSQTKFKSRDKPLQTEKGYAYSELNLYFERNHVRTKERHELYGFSDFLSNFGGLLGLFTGFSILSLVEVIYFLSLRIWGNIKIYRNWSGRNKIDVTTNNMTRL